jgi:energy-coupling factor transporter transmembrane protein EcfT
MHPSMRIFCLLVFAMMVCALSANTLNWLFLFAIAILFCTDVLQLKSQRRLGFGFKLISLSELFKLLRRMRYILLFMLIVYAFNTPGEYLSDWPLTLAPTYEGIMAGIEQAVRLSLVLAGLALLLANTSREQFIAGLYILALPFRHVGANPERFAVRLWLTLHYVEHLKISGRKGMLNQLKELETCAEMDRSAPETITLVNPQFGWQDVFIIMALISLGSYVICA